MALYNFDEEEQFEPEQETGGNVPVGGGGGGESYSQPPKKKSSNRTFLLAIGIIGVILILALVLLVMVAPGIMAQQRADQLEQAAQINAANTATAMAATALAFQNQATATPNPALFTPTKTPVVVLQTSTPAAVVSSGLSQSDQATVQALQTQMAAAQGGANGTATAIALQATALPESGFADEVGLPGMIGLAAVLIAVVFLSRKIRTGAH
jgi:cytoskeletal protein RodZ